MREMSSIFIHSYAFYFTLYAGHKIILMLVLTKLLSMFSLPFHFNQGLLPEELTAEVSTIDYTSPVTKINGIYLV